MTSDSVYYVYLLTDKLSTTTLYLELHYANGFSVHSNAKWYHLKKKTNTSLKHAWSTGNQLEAELSTASH